ncbi:PGLYRP3.2 family protein [Megaselia abdita]
MYRFLFISLLPLLAWTFFREDQKYLEIITRDEWQALPPRGNIPNINSPSLNIIVSDTATDPCFNKASCSKICREIQETSFLKGFPDIPYNFLIGSDGLIYEGRGWNKQNDGIGNEAIEITFIGNFNTDLPPSNSVDAFNLLLKTGIRSNLVFQSYNLFGRRQIDNGNRPGNAFYNLIQKWEHWFPKFCRL